MISVHPTTADSAATTATSPACQESAIAASLGTAVPCSALDGTPPEPLASVDGAPLPPAMTAAADADSLAVDDAPPIDGAPSTPTADARLGAATTSAAANSSEPARSLVPGLARVYTRRLPALDAAPPGPCSSPARASPQSGQRGRFLAKITKKTSKILPTPRANRLRSRTCAPCAPPRRSRRIAGMEPAPPSGGDSLRTKKKVMRALGIIGETAGIDQQSLEEYSKLFTGSARLPDSQALALSALFGWAAPEEEEQGMAADR